MKQETIVKLRSHRNVRGYYRASVMEFRGNRLNCLSSTDWKPNLILDSGLDKIAHTSWAQACQICVAGTKINPRPPKPSDTQLEEPFLMNSFWLIGDPYCGARRDGNTFKIWRTYDFYKVFSSVVITELGFKESPGATTLFSRIVLNPAQKLHAGQFLRVEYQLHIELSPTAPAAPDPVPVISGDPAWITGKDDRECLQRVGLCGVDQATAVAEPFDESGFCNEVFAPGSRSFGPGYGYVNRWQNGPAIIGPNGYLNPANAGADPYTVFGPLYDYTDGTNPAVQYRNPHEFWNFQFQHSNKFNPGGNNTGKYRGSQFTSSGADPRWRNYLDAAWVRDMVTHHGYPGYQLEEAAPFSGLRYITVQLGGSGFSGVPSALALSQLPDPLVKFTHDPNKPWEHALHRHFFDPALGVPQKTQNNEDVVVFHTGQYQTSYPDPNVYSLRSCVPFVLGTNGAILTSDAGVGWTVRNSTSVQWLTSVAFGNNVYVGVGYTGSIFKSSDGIVWTKQSSLTINRLEAVIWAGDRFVVVGELGTILTSVDGEVWITQNSGSKTFLDAVAHDPTGDVLVVAGRNGYIARSTDKGVGWVQWNGGKTAKFQVIVEDGSQGTAGEIRSITVIDGGKGYTSNDPAVLNMIIKDILPNPNPNNVVAGTGAVIGSVTVTDGVIMAVTLSNKGSGYHQQDGSTGTVLLIDPPQNVTDVQLFELTFGGGKFVGVGERGVVVTSADGITWAKQFSGENNSDVAQDLLAVAHNGTDKYVAVGAGGTILTSPDAVTWTAQASGVTVDLLDVAFGNGTYVVVGGFVDVNTGTSSNAILTSADAVTWTPQTPGIPRVLEAVAFGGGQFIVVGGIGTVAPVPEPPPGRLYWDDWRGPNVAGASCFLSNSDKDFEAFGSSPDLTKNLDNSAALTVELSLRLEPYQAGTFRRTKYVLFDTAVGNGTWKWVGIGPTSLSVLPAGMLNAAQYPGYLYRFNTANVKLDNHQLKLAFEYTWSRKE